MKVLEIYNIEGKKITPRNGQKIERGFALDEAGEWVEINRPATVKIWNDWDNQSQSSDKGMALIFDEPEKAEPEEPVIAAEKAEPSRGERLKAFEAERASKEKALIEELKAFKASEAELKAGIERVNAEWRLHDKSEKLAYMVDAILAEREDRFLKLGEAKNLKSLRSIREAKMPLSASEQAEEDARLKALNERLQAQEKARLDAEKESALKFATSTGFAQIVRSNAVFIDAKSRLVPKVFSRGDGDGGTKKVDMGYSEWVHEDAHYSADKTVSEMIKKGIIPSCFYTYLIKPVAEICDELTKQGVRK